MIKIKIIPSVHANNDSASCFLPSRYQRIDLPNTNVPVRAAEKTNNINIKIGINGVFSTIFIRPAKNGNDPIIETYTAVATEFNNAVFKIYFVIKLKINLSSCSFSIINWSDSKYLCKHSLKPITNYTNKPFIHFLNICYWLSRGSNFKILIVCRCSFVCTA